MLVQVKSNQEALLQAVEAVAENARCQSQSSELDHRRNRIEHRQVFVYKSTALSRYLEESRGWSDSIQAVIKVCRSTDRFETRLGDWRCANETAYYIATEVQSAEFFAKAIRGHWGIENRNHYVRDVTLKEDASRIRCNPGIMARLRSFTLNILRKNNITNISEALYDNALCLKNLWQYAGII